MEKILDLKQEQCLKLRQKSTTNRILFIFFLLVFIPRRSLKSAGHCTKQLCLIKTESNETRVLSSLYLILAPSLNAANVFEGLAEFTQISFVADSSGGL